MTRARLAGGVPAQARQRGLGSRNGCVNLGAAGQTYRADLFAVAGLKMALSRPDVEAT